MQSFKLVLNFALVELKRNFYLFQIKQLNRKGWAFKDLNLTIIVVEKKN